MPVGSLLGPPSAHPSAVTEIQLQGPDPPGSLARSLPPAPPKQGQLARWLPAHTSTCQGQQDCG